MSLIDMFSEFLDQFNALGKICLAIGAIALIFLIVIFALTFKNTRKIKKEMLKLQKEQGDVISNLVQANVYLKYLCQVKEFELNNLTHPLTAENFQENVVGNVIVPEAPKPQVPLPSPTPEEVVEETPKAETPSSEPIIPDSPVADAVEI